MKTTFHAYSFDTRTPEGAAAWEHFQRARKAAGARIMGPVFHESAGERSADNGAEITLETAHLFDNQWNATFPDGRGVRVFDWLLEAEAPSPRATISAPRGIKRGHYLEQTPEMRAIRRETLKCGYCGNMEPAEGIDQARAFCPKCRGSIYLKPGGLAPYPPSPGCGHRRGRKDSGAERRRAGIFAPAV